MMQSVNLIQVSKRTHSFMSMPEPSAATLSIMLEHGGGWFTKPAPVRGVNGGFGLREDNAWESSHRKNRN